MSLLNVVRITAILLGIVAAFFTIPILVAVVYAEYAIIAAFAIPLALFGGLGLVALFLLPRGEQSFTPRDGYLVVTLGWFGAAAVGAVPFVLSGAIPSVIDAYFEAVSGFSTTGASILTDIESLPRSILFWRSLTHWLGGMGIIVLMVAILPLIGWGGRQLIKAEAPWPTLDKFTPRITQTAKVLWFVYLGMTALQTALLAAGGLDWFDALTHTFGTVATGGFSPYNASIAHFESAYVEGVITVFMVLAGANFMLYVQAFRGNFKVFAADGEFRTYLAVLLSAVVLISLVLVAQSGGHDSVRHAFFHSASIMTTTGFVASDYALWPQQAQVVLFLMMFVGGCAGSTGGGIKVARIHVLAKQSLNELRYLVYPRGVFPLTVGRVALRKETVYAISSFFVFYIALVLFGMALVASGGATIMTSLSASLATLGNIGPGFDGVGPTDNYAAFPDYVKVGLSGLMVLGRLEITTIMVLLLPDFWRS